MEISFGGSQSEPGCVSSGMESERQEPQATKGRIQAGVADGETFEGDGDGERREIGK